MERKLFVTGDGSHSVLIPEMNVTYHSTHGAIAESMHVFVETGFNYEATDKQNVDVLEIGFGTGLNALLTLIESEKQNLFVRYVSIEKYPLDISCADLLNYIDLLNQERYGEIFREMHTSDWDVDVRLSSHFTLHKMRGDVTDVVISGLFDVVYFDAFDPVAQPGMWTADIFNKLKGCMKSGAVLVTYCSKGKVRRLFEQLGFGIEKLKGPEGKREIMRARRN